MRNGNFPRQRQPEPRAVRAPRYERLEQAGRYVGGDAGPCVANLQDHGGIKRILGRGHRDGAALRRMLQRVGNQVVQRPAERARIEAPRFDADPCLQIDPGGCAALGEALDPLTEPISEPHLPEMGADRLGFPEQFLNAFVQAPDLPQDKLQCGSLALRPHQRILRFKLHGGERVADFMRHCRRHSAERREAFRTFQQRVEFNGASALGVELRPELVESGTDAIKLNVARGGDF